MYYLTNLRFGQIVLTPTSQKVMSPLRQVCHPYVLDYILTFFTGETFVTLWFSGNQ